jgi:hypothetical protein
MSAQPPSPRGSRPDVDQQRRVAELLERKQRTTSRRFERDVKRPNAQVFRHRSR